jgi:hypothetical protein
VRFRAQVLESDRAEGEITQADDAAAAFACFTGKETMCFQNAVRLVPESVMLDGRFSSEESIEHRSVAAVFGSRAKRLAILNKRFHALCRSDSVNRDELSVKRIKKDLKRGEALLIIDDDALLHMSRLPGHLLENDCT